LDEQAGILRCEAGVTLAQILNLTVPRGWFLPVTPGTQFVSVGGAIAHDVHGKNHHKAGTFGRFVNRLGLWRSDGQVLECSYEQNRGLYRATIGGMGLTGLILWAELRLKPISSSAIEIESERFAGLDDYFALAADADRANEYTVAWIDCLARGRRLGRGRFIRGDHGVDGDLLPASRWRPKLRIEGSRWFGGPPVVRAFNTVYYRAHRRRMVRRRIHYDRFFYPLDRIGAWNRVYGRRGFLQYQCVVPWAHREAIREMITRASQAAEAPFLSVIKLLGSIPSPGLLSFPREGVTLALDFPIRGGRTFDLLESFDKMVREVGGAVYPAKDARMSPRSFRAFFPVWKEFVQYIDPAFSSSFWRRVNRSEG
jgi:FAD/FMN-containing dehydrogenase